LFLPARIESRAPGHLPSYILSSSRTPPHADGVTEQPSGGRIFVSFLFGTAIFQP
jgi:hypothetical protein